MDTKAESVSWGRIKGEANKGQRGGLGTGPDLPTSLISSTATAAIKKPVG